MTDDRLRTLLPAVFAVALAAGAVPAADAPMKPFAVRVIDEATGRGVPLVELRTTSHLRFVTDSNGLVAFDEPGFMGKDVFFTVTSHGYEYPEDGFGNRGTALRVAPGGSATLKVKRNNIAERLYRVTGAGLYADSVKLGRQTPLKEPLLNAGVVGCDSVLAVVYRGKVHWFWGDTLRAAYPLGNYDATGATSELPGKGGLDPARGVDLTYFADGKGFVRGVCPMPGNGPTWIESVAVLPDESGKERMLASYVKIEGTLKVHARGLAEWDDGKGEFVKTADVDLAAPLYPKWHSFRHRDGDAEHVYFGHPFPLVRTRATAAGFADLASYEAFTCLLEGSTVESPKIDRGPDGKARHTWRKGVPPLDQEAQAELVKAGHLKEDEAPLRLRGRGTGRAVRMHNGSVNWNAYRKRWVMVGNEIGGKPSLLGEVWYAEADALTGPWADAVKVATHDRMDFYNPTHHPFFDRDGGRVIYFEGTYTNTFSGNPDATPRYEYNQVMYRLDLSDQRLHAPAAK